MSSLILINALKQGVTLTSQINIMITYAPIKPIIAILLIAGSLTGATWLKHNRANNKGQS